MSKKKHQLVEKKAFTSPGTLVYVGKEVNEPVKAKLLSFSSDKIEEKSIRKFKDNTTYLNEEPGVVEWLNVDGVQEVSVIESIGFTFKLHPLLLEDVLNTFQKPKIEHFEDNQIFIVLKSLHFNDLTESVEQEQVSIVLGKDYVITFQENGGVDVFAPIENRLKTSIGKTRRGKADYLFYSFCDVIIDSYFVLLERLSDKIEDLEIRILENPKPQDQKTLYSYKSELLRLRKAIYPLRDIFGTLVRDDSPLIHDANKLYFRDVYDHVLQVLDIIDTYREMLENVQNIYLNNLSAKMNNVMKTLTVFTAIFMPLTFIAGIYGMNFENMPELKTPNGYFVTLAVMTAIGAGMWVYFKWKKYV